MRKEQWKHIDDLNDEYMISDLGNFMALAKTVKYKDGRVYSYPEKILKQTYDKDGYLILQVTKNNKMIFNQKAHRVVAKYFLGNQKDKVVNHINGIKDDNRASNLEWTTQKKNCDHAIEEGLASRDQKTGKFEAKVYKISEIFGPTIQGEGTHSGKVVKFLRFAGCNKWNSKPEDKPKSICHFCDTDFTEKERLSRAQIIERLRELSGKSKIIVISGGEPLLQLDIPLAASLKNQGYELHVETNGSMPLKGLSRYIDHITMSPKQGPTSTKLEYCHDLKILYPYINEEITWTTFKNFQHQTAYLQPVWGTDLKPLLETLYQNENLHLSMQNHKILGLA